MNQTQKDFFADLAALEVPREACALLVRWPDGEDVIMRCENLAKNDGQFILSPESWIMAAQFGEIVGIVHSHPSTPAKPSDHDRSACQASALPWWIYSVLEDRWTYLEPDGFTPPLIGRKWVHATMDCYTLVRDYYRLEQGIHLPNYDRGAEWWKHGADLYTEHFAEAGFDEIDLAEILPGDAILLKIGSKVPNHAAIYVGDGMILHHLMNELSRRELLTDSYLRRITHVLRYNRAP